MAAGPQRPAGADLQPGPRLMELEQSTKACNVVRSQVILFPSPGKPEAFKSVRSISHRELEAVARHRRIDPDEEEAEWYACSSLSSLSIHIMQQ